MHETDSPLDVVVARGPEGRTTHLIEGLIDDGRVKSVSVLHFTNYDQSLPQSASEEDRRVMQAYWENARILTEILTSQNVSSVQVDTCFESTAGLRRTGHCFGNEKTLLVDISCIPRMHLTALVLRLLEEEAQRRDRVLLGYTHVGDYKTDESSFSVGVTGYAGVPGLSGRIRHVENVAVVIAGFEGNRALSAYRRLDPVSAHVLLGDTVSPEWRDVAYRNNHQLLSNHRVKCSPCSCYDPHGFLRDLVASIVPLRQRFPKCNLCIVPLGTKVQTAASVLLVAKLPELQFFFTQPTVRRLSSVGVGKTEIFDLAEMCQSCEAAWVDNRESAA